jgi:hypothetical protein
MRQRGWLVEFLVNDKAALSPTVQLLEVSEMAHQETVCHVSWSMKLFCQLPRQFFFFF